MAAVLVAACGTPDIESVSEAKTGSLEVTFSLPGVSTKAGDSSTSQWDGDETVKNVQLAVFSASGTKPVVANYYFTNTSDGMSGAGVTYENGKFKKTFGSLPVGSYDVVVLTNQPQISNPTKETDLTGSGKSITLSSSGIKRKDGSTALGVPGYGIASNVSVSQSNTAGSPAAANVSVSKLPFRVMLKSLTTAIPYGSPTVNINCAYLSNALMTWTASGRGTPSGMANKAGRNGSTLISTSSQAEAAYADWTVRDISVTNVGNSYTLPDGKKGGFYAFKNGVTEANDSFNGAFTAETTERTRLVIAASWNGTACWYPVTIPSPQAGYTYDVTVVITGMGSTDPNKPVVHGNMAVSVTVNPWNGSGTAISEEF